MLSNREKMRRIQLELRALKDKIAEIPQDFFDNHYILNTSYGNSFLFYMSIWLYKNTFCAKKCNICKILYKSPIGGVFFNTFHYVDVIVYIVQFHRMRHSPLSQKGP